MNNNSPTNEIIVHCFVRRIRREMNWRKRSVGLTSIEANQLRSLTKFQKDCISYLNYLALSMQRIRVFVKMHSQQLNLSTNDYLSSSDLSPLMETIKLTAMHLTIQLRQIDSKINDLTILYRSMFLLAAMACKEQHISVPAGDFIQEVV